MLISNSSFMHNSKSLQSFSLVYPKNDIIDIYLYYQDITINKVVSTLPLTKLLFTRKLLSLSYQALGACFKPYKAFSSLKTKSECVGSKIPGVVQHTHSPQ